ncbi:methylosome subunit pICln-like [Amphibalanus amphitrite]|uniref:methylosome subunit pICln-like n=1 Tax=Amphibalanus amphitrite TaxID=1232801 RepID=UPI001C8FECD7|nr:methylosome subunit pICln-like [Amphibalanus amphitrite]XP_043188878.1 methylosome subunit pICln-like [Amphibalanus amphitrite]XP_043233320.1 methylosome subunit pICln-like [Amphibalanus amphitrite]XP_043233321.1 methylosome subunit pICln-like [Amphibalanus amphitrite]XP_043233322.1 methylosome subunit pICln-like [Amphibalanus amphitrite]XP_043233323.1 methylosome subunit pICln-like [Amphibalanus amphitrite]
MVVVTSSLPPPTEGVRIEQPSTAAHMGPRALGSGTLYIAESRVAWAGTDGQGFSLEYPHIMLHAVSRDTSAFPHPCLYLMVDAKIGPQADDAASDGSGGSSDEDAASGSSVTEVRFVPSDGGSLDALFHAMSECQSLHPDPNDSVSADEDDYFVGGDCDAEGDGDDDESGPMSNGGGAGDSGEPMETGQFDDPEE